MADELDLRFSVPDGQLVVPAAVIETVESPHTGRPLRRLRSEITVPAAEARLIATAIGSGPLTDEEGNEWSGGIEVESYGDAQGLHNLRINWEEREQLLANAVEFGGLSLRPQRYEEHEDGRSVSIAFRAILSLAETERLRELQRLPSSKGDLYFPVVRRGVSDEPREMRFGRVLWQQLEDGNVEHEIVLVDKSFDQQPTSAFASIGEPQTGHLLDAVEQLAAERNALFDALQSIGVLDDQAIERVRRAGADAIGQQRYVFYQVSDLSDWN